MDNGEILLSEERKAEAIFCYFDDVLGTSPICSNTVNLDLLDLPYLDSSGLGDRFSEGEVWAVIRALLPDKAPGSDRFTTRFLQVCWELIKPDVMAAFDAF
jgi:hypothetical protein